MYRSLLSLFILSLTANLAGCGADAEDEPASAAQYSVLHSGEYVESGATSNKRAEVFTSQGDYESALARYTNSPAANVDFSTHSVLLIDMGERPTGGFNIGITSMDAQRDHLIARITLSQPEEGCAVTEAVTNPYQFVEVQTTADILIRETLVTVPCD